MPKITQKKIIESIKELKQIKPREEWVVLLKSQILSSQQKELACQRQNHSLKLNIITDIFLPIFSAFSKRKLAYSFALFLLLLMGVFGFAQYTVPGDLLFPLKEITEKSQAVLTRQPILKQNIASFSSSINYLSQAAKEGKVNNIPSAITKVNESALALAKNLKENSVEDVQILQEVSKTLARTLADMPGTDVTVISGIQELLDILISDYQKISLSEEQLNILSEAESLYKKGRYADALEKILLINN